MHTIHSLAEGAENDQQRQEPQEPKENSGVQVSVPSKPNALENLEKPAIQKYVTPDQLRKVFSDAEKQRKESGQKSDLRAFNTRICRQLWENLGEVPLGKIGNKTRSFLHLISEELTKRGLGKLDITQSFITYVPPSQRLANTATPASVTTSTAQDVTNTLFAADATTTLFIPDEEFQKNRPMPQDIEDCLKALAEKRDITRSGKKRTVHQKQKFYQRHRKLMELLWKNRSLGIGKQEIKFNLEWETLHTLQKMMEENGLGTIQIYHSVSAKLIYNPASSKAATPATSPSSVPSRQTPPGSLEESGTSADQQAVSI